ncbi:MAG: colanic acid biosynthesis glycosyltransferase WcaL [Phycisphaerae bacterium]|nr:colanic acid biosynthesis glycosyltransferase WcaL [Phycisphaerae bacterium]
MRIAFVTNAMIAPSEVFILNQITGLIDRGHSIDIFAYPKVDKGQPVHEDVLKYRLDRYFSPHPAIPSNKWLCRFQTGWVTLLRLIRRPWVTIRTLRHFLNRPEGFLYFEYRVALSLIRRSYDVVYCHYGPNGNLAAFLKGVDPRSRLVAVFHGYDYQMAVGESRDMYRDLFQTADLLMANSPSTREKVINLGADPDSIRIHPMGIDPNRFPLRSRPPKSAPDPLRILTVARYVPKKGLDYGIRAFRKIKDRFPNRDISYDIIGFGPEQDALQRLINELNLTQSVSLLGPRSNEQVIQRMMESDLFVLPSILEPLGVVLLEAQAAGLPIVATETDGIPFAVVPGRSALLVPPADADALADKICWLIDNPRVWPDMGAAGRAHIQAHFDIRRLNDALVTVFEDLRKPNTRNSACGINPAAESADNTKSSPDKSKD